MTDFLTKDTSSYARLLFTEALAIADEVAYPIEVEFIAGYGAVVDVPEAIKTAIKQYVLFLYENRGDVAPDSKRGLPIEVETILRKYRIVNTFG